MRIEIVCSILEDVDEYLPQEHLTVRQRVSDTLKVLSSRYLYNLDVPSAVLPVVSPFAIVELSLTGRRQRPCVVLCPGSHQCILHAFGHKTPY